MARPDSPPHPCAACAFHANSVWQPVGAGSVSMLAHGFRRQELGEGQVLFEQGHANTGVTCVSAGLIALRTHHPDGRSTLMRLAYPGEIIGIRSFLGQRAHQTEARALLPSRVCTVDARRAGAILRSDPAVLTRLAARCIDEIDRNHDRIIATATMSNKDRLADLLLRLMRAHGAPTADGLQMHLPLSRSDLADLIGVQSETLSRLIGRLESDGRFRMSGRKVRMTGTPDSRPVPVSSPATAR